MLFLKSKRLLAMLLALMLALPAALAEDAVWNGEASDGVEAPPIEAVVPEEAEMDLPLGDAPAEIVGDESAGDAAPAQPEGAAQPVPDELGQPEGEQAVSAPAEQPEGEQAVSAPAEDPYGDETGAEADQEVSAPGESLPVLATTALTLGVKEKGTLGLSGGATPQDVGAAFVSSNPKIAAVNASTGVVTGKKAGTATITMTAQGVESTCAVTVRKAPKKIKLSATKLTMGVGEDAFLGVTLTSGSASAISFSSSKPGVVAVDGDGHLVATGVGSATITARTFNKKKATCKVTVKAAPEYVTLSASALTLWQGRSVDLKPVLSPGSGGTVYCESSDPGVASVTGTLLRAVGIGSATVTVTTYNGKSASMAVQVTRAPVYRALLVGESRFPGTNMSSLPSDKDVSMMTKMLRSVKGPSGDGWAISSYNNLTSNQIRNAIRNVFAGAQEGDVSLFYISTHGDEEQSIDGRYPEYAGYLQTYPDYAYSNWYDRNALTLVALAAWLAEVPGQVIVLIDSCGSGAAIYNAKGVSASAYSPESFNAAVIGAFRDEDKGVLAPGMDQGAFVVENKFYVLTATAYQETGWSLKGKYSFYCKWLTDGIGTKGKMPADADKNRMTTLNELYTYMKKKADKKEFKVDGWSYKQHVQVYPANSGFEMFYRK